MMRFFDISEGEWRSTLMRELFRLAGPIRPQAAGVLRFHDL
jgi:hypothetical protein